MSDRRVFLKSIAAALLAVVTLRPVRAWAKKLGIALDKAEALKTVGGSAILEIKGRQVLFVRDSDATVRALDPTCTHLKCLVFWDAKLKRIRCPCHDSAYDLDGKVLAGPAPRPLKTFPAELSGDRVILTLED